VTINLTVSALYVVVISWIYSVEISIFWNYMRFEGTFDAAVFLIIAIGAVLLSAALPVGRDARAYLLNSLHYFFFLPSLVYIAFNDVMIEYKIAFVLSALIVYIGSAVRLRVLTKTALKRLQIFTLIQALILISLFLQGAFGGFNSLNFNLEAVYEFRSSTANQMPSIFGYLYSNVAGVLIPASIVLSVIYRSRMILIVSLTSGILLFAMAHHKSILFSTFFVLFVFLLINRYKSPKAISVLSCAMVGVCATEIILIDVVFDLEFPGIVTSYLVRRALLVPPMIDAAYFELFTNAPKYLWSTSRLGLGIVDNPYESVGPYQIAKEIFKDPTMSANAGLIGSGYSHAGILGTIIYSTIIATIISYLNSVGKKVGHEFISALSMPTILMIFTSTDLSTALLTHGLGMLLLLVSILPREVADKALNNKRKVA
jgi:hypothetical protein